METTEWKNLYVYKITYLSCLTKFVSGTWFNTTNTKAWPTCFPTRILYAFHMLSMWATCPCVDSSEGWHHSLLDWLVGWLVSSWKWCTMTCSRKALLSASYLIIVLSNMLFFVIFSCTLVYLYFTLDQFYLLSWRRISLLFCMVWVFTVSPNEFMSKACTGIWFSISFSLFPYFLTLLWLSILDQN
jgi:hypothetical protein